MVEAGILHEGRPSRALLVDFIKYSPALVLPRLTAIVTIPVLTRLFAPDAYGEYALTLSAIGAAVSLASGLEAYLVRFYPAHQTSQADSDRYLSHVFTLLGFVTLLISAIGLIAVRAIVPMWSETLRDLLSYGVGVIAVSILFSASSALFRSTGRSNLYVGLQLAQGYGSFLVGLGLVLLFRTSAVGLLWGTISMSIVTGVAAWLFLSRRHAIQLELPRWLEIKSTLQFAAFTSLSNGIFWVLNLSDRWLIGILRGPTEAGIYSVSYDLAGKTLPIGIMALSLSLMPLISSLWERGGRASVEQFMPTVARLYIVIMLPAAVGLAVLAPTVLRVMASSKYDTGFIVIPLVAIGSFLYGLVFVFGRAFPLAQRPDLESRNYVLAGFFNVGLNLALIPIWGYRAAALTTFLGYAALLVIHVRASRQFLRWQFPFDTLARCSIGSAAIVVAVLLGDQALVGTPPLIRLFSELVISVIVYVLIITIIGEVPRGQLRRFISPGRAATR